LKAELNNLYSKLGIVTVTCMGLNIHLGWKK